MLTKQQEERFDKFAEDECIDFIPDGEGDEINLYLEDTNTEGIKDFLANELSLQLSEIIQIAEGMTFLPEERKHVYMDDKNQFWYDKGQNDVLRRLISTLTTLQEKK